MHRAEGGQSSYAAAMKPRLTPPTAALWEIAVPSGSSDILSSPIVDDSRSSLFYVRTQPGNDTLHSVGSTSGKETWTRSLDGFRDVYGSYPTGVVLADGSVLAADRTGVYRYAANGTQLWKNEAEYQLVDDLIVTPSGLVITGPLLCSPMRTNRRRGGRGAVAARTRGLYRRNGGGGGNATSPDNSYTYFAYRVSDGGLAWGITLDGAVANFCSSAMVGPMFTAAASTSTASSAANAAVVEAAAAIDGALYVTTSTLGDTSFWFALNFNATAAWIAGNGT